jgi:hypothetical protein
LSAESVNAATNADDEKYGLFQLYEPSESRRVPVNTKTADQRLCDVDIVAIHGINGDALRTWTHTNGKCWLKDFLPDSLPRARIYSFGYASELAFNHSLAVLGDFARRLFSDLNGVRSSPQVSFSLYIVDWQFMS